MDGSKKYTGEKEGKGKGQKRSLNSGWISSGLVSSKITWTNTGQKTFWQVCGKEEDRTTRHEKKQFSVLNEASRDFLPIRVLDRGKAYNSLGKANSEIVFLALSLSISDVAG